MTTMDIASRPDTAGSGAQEIALLRLATAGSVDDGKSTLVGRLLYDTKTVLSDQLDAVARVSRERGLAATDLALLTDGLRAEREQGITIDVAYRYFATPRRRFILADTPGHVQYTRNMVTGASTAQLAVILVDARHGVVEQTRRHAAIAALLKVPHVVLAVNKMDLAGYSESVFAAIAAEFGDYAVALGAPPATAIPISALMGDNVVDGSGTMPWYRGPTLIEHLETVDAHENPAGQHARFPVQYVLRPQSGDEFRDYRGYAGRLVSGVLRTGDEVVVLPSGERSVIAGIDRLGRRDVGVACAPQSVTLRLADDVDVARGDVIAPVTGAPATTREVTATVCHVAERPLRAGDRVLVRHGAAVVTAVVRRIDFRLDIDDLDRADGPAALVTNEMGQVALRLGEPLPLDAYTDNRHTGSFLIIDPDDGATLAAAMNGPLGAGFAGRRT
ncbi:MAG TPA: GTP-binding protein [Actinocrinis sp.]|nr:GTP-binding protein [Actinocrinis sp.]